VPALVGTFSNIAMIAFVSCSSVKPANAAPLTVKDALSPGLNPSATLPDPKVLPVRKPKSRTTDGAPGTAPRTPSPKVKVELRLGACCPVNPLSPEGLAFPIGGKSKPNAVIVDVEPGSVIADVFVAVKVKVFVCELNSATTVAVE
jgi:hypothetical protein